MSTPPVPSRHDGVRYLYMLAAFVVIVAGIRAAEPILNPLLLAVFLSVICAPAYFALLRKGISQWLSLLIIAGGLSAVAVVLLAVVMQSISSFTASQQRHQQQIPERLHELLGWMEDWLPDSTDETAAPAADSASEFADDAAADSETASPLSPPDAEPPDDAEHPLYNTSNGESVVSPDATEEPASVTPVDGGENEYGASAPGPPVTMMDQILDQFNPKTMVTLAVRLAGSLRNLLSNIVLIVLTVIFILLEAGSFEDKLSQAFPHRDDTSNQAAQMVQKVQRYMAIKTMISIFTAVLIGLWLKLFGVSYISLWVLLAFLLNFIPNIGSIVAAVPAVLIAWLEFGILPALGCSAGYVVVNVVIGNLLEPRLMGQDLGLSPLVIFCSMVFWGWVLGPVGMLLSVPLTMTLHIVLNGFDDTRWIATLLGGRTSKQR